MQPGKILAGTVLHGEYVLLGAIGEVGHDVFRANHRGDNRTVAVRIWRGDPAGDVEHNLEIAGLASRVRHPLLATVEAYGQEPDGSLPFVVSEYVAGQRLDQWADSVGIPPLAGVMDYVHKLCLALHVVHRAGFAHHAVNPRNLVMFRGSTALGQRFNAKLLDHGVPSFMRSRPPRLRSALFMAPEQLVAAVQPGASTTLERDSRIDVYACGCLLYYLCSGGAPFPSRSLRELLAAHAGAKMLPPSRINPNISEALEAVILRALSPHAQERYRDGAELAAAIEEVRRSSSISGVVPRFGTPSTPTPMLEGAALGTLPTDDFDERPTSESAIPLAALHAEWSADPTRPQDSTARDEVDTERPPPTSPPVKAVSPVVPPSPKLPELRHPFEPLVAPSSPAPVRLGSAPPAPNVPQSLRAATAAVVARGDAPKSNLIGSAAGQTRWLRVWWVWPVAGALCVTGYLQLERWATRAKVERTTTGSAIGSTEPRPSSDEPPAASPQSSTLAPQQDPKPIARRGWEATPQHPQSTLARATSKARVPGGGAPPAPHAASIVPERALEKSASAASPRTGNESAGPKELQAQEQLSLDQPQPTGAPESSNDAQRIERSTPPAARTAPRSPTGPVEARRSAQPLTADARIVALLVRGSLATSEVRRAVERIRPQLAQCYTRSAAEAGRNAFGELNLEVEIDEGGRAHNPRATGSVLPGLDHCVEQAVTKVVSARPPDTGIVKASWRVAFVPRVP